MEDLQNLDPETEFLASNQQTGNEWELFKENVKPLKRGRNIGLLNNALKSQFDNGLKKSLLENRRRLIEAIDEYQGDDPLQPWLQCIKWVQESFPSGGDCSGIVVILEQCVRIFWHTDRYKEDARYLKVWLEYAENCADAEVIYNFLDANNIGQTHSLYYTSYALHMESKNKMKSANDIFNLGISRRAQPIEKLEASYRKFLTRSLRKQNTTTEEDSTENHLPVRSFGTLLSNGEARRQNTEISDPARKKLKLNRAHNAPLSIYKDRNDSITQSHEPLSMFDMRTWNTLGTRAERNKENAAIPTTWASNKIPQRPGSRSRAAATSACIEVFVDEECAELPTTVKQDGNPSVLQLKQGDSKDLKKETELLKENPLRNFPLNSFPR
ncbi:mitotic spindle checkpoint protein BUBR1 isoform X2 [Telopea speciosissima]|uniref:mitotic spindle checkpoint protein BUBR1 isoform X2 n=1 Tax=Telopea speciosissima TaxID=54955 RepID=UPI001CC54A0B|nr:mitotic spindle checkpoint protein BUBR1 isoform X2 [Telopea speciosissima]